MSEQHVCPVWVGYLLSCPLRKLVDNPRKLLAPYIETGMIVIDAGCAMGFFSLPMAEMVGPEGRVICIDLQEKMVTRLYRKAKKKGISGRVEVRVCTPNSLNTTGLENSADFALASAVVHEVPDRGAFLADLREALKDGGKLLVVEPESRISEQDFSSMLETAEKTGFTVVSRPDFGKRRAVLLKKIIQEKTEQI